MGKITIEDQDGKRVYIGEVNSINILYDFWKINLIDGGSEHGRTGNGELNLSMNFVNGRADTLQGG
jgi:hypothetical protein